MKMIITDERYSPESVDIYTGYEHIHRYLFATQYTKGKKVLDLAFGEGYGSALLAQSASEVIGIDIFPDAVKHARAKYPSKNLTFQLGSIESIPLNDLFDVIVCFEAIEHISNHDLLCKEVKRLLKPDGIFIVSTPNKWVYSENGITKNPYHLKELDLTELETLLKNHFHDHHSYGQKTVVSSRIFPLSAPANFVEENRIEMGIDGFRVTAEEDSLPRYHIAIASDQRIKDCERGSYLTDIAPRKEPAQWVVTEKTSLTPKQILKRLLLRLFTIQQLKKFKKKLFRPKPPL